MKKLTLSWFLVLVACSKQDPSDTAKPVESAKTGPAKIEPAKQPEPAKPAPVETAQTPPNAKTVTTGDPTEADKKLVGEVGDATKLQWKSSSGDLVQVEVKPRVDRKHIVVDVIENGKVVHTIPSGVEKGDIHMEAHAAVKAIPEGILVVVKAIKVTGKPADSYIARVLTWNESAKQLAVGRTIQFEDAYDPEIDG